MNIFVSEFVCGGGFSKTEIPSSLFSEAFAMLNVLISSFTSDGDNVFTTLDSRLAPIQESLAADSKIINGSEDYFNGLKKHAQDADLILCIAPETDNILLKCSRILKKYANDKYLGCNEDFIKRTGDKWSTKTIFSNLGIPHPRTYLLDFKNAVKLLKKGEKTYILKPRDGIGGEGLFLVKNAKDLLHAEKNNNYLKNEEFIIQEYIFGKHRSISLLCGNNNSILTINRQLIQQKNNSFEYMGGELPLKDPLYQKIELMIQRFLNNTPGAKGWIGLDFLRNHNHFWIIECNPRITSSIIGIWCLDHRILANNFKSLLNFSDFKSLSVCYSIFKKVYCNKPENWEDTIDLLKNREVISPPFPFHGKSCAMIGVQSNTREEGQKNIEKLERMLLH